jgi:hypothetical protein
MWEGDWELGLDAPGGLRVAAVFAELASAIWRPADTRSSVLSDRQMQQHSRRPVLLENPASGPASELHRSWAIYRVR